MAWNIHWQCCFQSFEGVQYAVNVYEQDYGGSIVPLTGAAEPFVTQEDDDDNIFTPIRVQTGYLRVIDTDGTLLEDMIPANNTEKLVRLVTGTYSNGTFTQDSGNDSVKWQGFLQAQAYTQPWDNQVNVLELPVKSLLGALEDMQIPDSGASQETRIAGVVARAFTDLLQDNGATAPYGYVYSVDDGVSSSNWLTARVQWAVFFSEETVNNEGDSYQQLVGVSYYEALEMCLSLFGLTAREDGMNLYFAHYDQTASMQCKVLRYLWSAITSMAGGGSIQVNNLGDLTATDMLAALTFKGADNVAGFLQGARSAKVEVKLDGLSLHINLPQTTESGESPSELNMSNGDVFVQPHSNRSGGVETFAYMKINVSSTENPNDTYSNTFTYGAPSSYSECLSDSVINKPNYTPMPYIIDGAFPCRWFFRHKDSSDFVSLKNGLFLNMQSVNLGLDTPYWSAIYTIRTLIEVNIQDGYIHIDFKQHSFIYSGGSQGCFNTDDRMTEGYKTQMWVQLSVGQYYWDGNNWSANAGSRFPIPFVNETITSNKTTDMQVDGNDGWFIPVTGLLSGYMRFSILGVMESGTDFIASHVYANSRIISDLDVSFLANNSLAASSRGSNVYRESIMSSGFSQDIAINSGIGTINNNLRSPSFIKSSTTEYIEQMTYYTGTNTTTTQRPELRLLARMVRYYGTVRRTFTGVVQRGLDVMLQRYMYIGFFFGIRAKTNWRDDTEDVKFIEV